MLSSYHRRLQSGRQSTSRIQWHHPVRGHKSFILCTSFHLRRMSNTLKVSAGLFPGILVEESRRRHPQPHLLVEKKKQPSKLIICPWKWMYLTFLLSAAAAAINSCPIHTVTQAVTVFTPWSRKWIYTEMYTQDWFTTSFSFLFSFDWHKPIPACMVLCIKDRQGLAQRLMPIQGPTQLDGQHWIVTLVASKLPSEMGGKQHPCSHLWEWVGESNRSMQVRQEQKTPITEVYQHQFHY